MLIKIVEKFDKFSLQWPVW